MCMQFLGRRWRAANRQRLPNLRARTTYGGGTMGVMDQVLLERDDTLAALIGAVEDAAAGRGSVVLVSGGAGIGKTSVVRAFAREAAGRARVLLSACDDLMAPRTLGPLRDAALESGGPLEAAFADGRPVDGVFTAVLAELAAAPPTALVVEDVHWADDATIDVLGYVARRIEPVPAVLVLTFRDDELGPSHPLQRLLGALAGRPVHRLALPPLSRAAVRQLAASTGADAGAVHRVTGGNPFFVTEVLASPADAVPATVVEAVLARVRRLGPDCREALEQLSVVPSRIRFELAGELLGDRIDTLAEAELAGVLEVLRAPSRLPPRAGAASDRAQPAGARAAAPERARPARAPAAGAARPGEPDALRRRGGRRRDRARRRSGRRARGGPGRVAPAGARAPRVGPPAPAPARRARAGGRARRLRLGALQRPSLPRGGRRRAGGGRAVRAARRPGRRRPLPRARVAPPVHGGRDGRGRGVRGPGRDDPRADGRHRRARVGVAGPRRDPRAHRRARAGGRHARARPRPRPARRPRRPRGARAQLPRRRGGRARRSRRPAAGARQRRGRARRGATTRSPRAATATSPSCCTARGGWPSWRRASPRGCRSPASAGSGRTPTTSSCTAACCSCAAATSTARSRACASSSTASRTRACCSPTASPGSAGRWRGAATRRPAGCWPGPGTARSASGCCSASPTRAWPPWNGRGWPGGRRSPSASRPRSRRGSRTPAPRRSAPSWRAISRAPASPPSRSTAARSRGRRACAATGRRPPTAGRRRATRTSRRSS